MADAPVSSAPAAEHAAADHAAAEHAAGETGPQYHEERLSALTDELAALLLEEQRTREQAKA